MTIHMLLLWNLKKLDDMPNPDQCQVIKKYQADLMKYCHTLLFHSRDKICEDVSIQDDACYTVKSFVRDKTIVVFLKKNNCIFCG